MRNDAFSEPLFDFLSGHPLNFYDPLRAEEKRAPYVDLNRLGNTGFITLEPHNKRAGFRPSISWYGYQEGSKNAPEVSKKARLSKAKGAKGTKDAAPKPKPVGNILRRILSDDDDEDFSFFAPYCPTVSYSAEPTKPKLG